MEDTARKQRGAEKTARIPIKIVPAERLKKPEWIRIKLCAGAEVERFNEIKDTLREHKLHTVCEEASCPNIGECFGHGTATFMIMGEICTRRCPFCDVAHGRPLALDADEPRLLGETIAAMKLRYVVVTSVDRDDLRDGGAGHFADCIRSIRATSPGTKIEILTPDFRCRLYKALAILAADPPDVMNHNLETVPRLYAQARPGSDYAHSLRLLADFKAARPGVPPQNRPQGARGEANRSEATPPRTNRATTSSSSVGVYAGRVGANAIAAPVETMNSPSTDLSPALPSSSRMVRASSGRAGT